MRVGRSIMVQIPGATGNDWLDGYGRSLEQLTRVIRFVYGNLVSPAACRHPQKEAEFVIFSRLPRGPGRLVPAGWCGADRRCPSSSRRRTGSGSPDPHAGPD